MNWLDRMPSNTAAFDDFVDDCFLDEDPLCNVSRDKSLELVASQLISELVLKDEDLKDLLAILSKNKIAVDNPNYSTYKKLIK